MKDTVLKILKKDDAELQNIFANPFIDKGLYPEYIRTYKIQQKKKQTYRCKIEPKQTFTKRNVD